MMGETRELNIGDIIMRQNPEMAALAWVNFLKRLKNGGRENREREILINTLRNNAANFDTTTVASPLYQDADESVAELLAYLHGRLKPEQSKIYGISPGNHYELPPLEKNRLVYKELTKAVDEMVDINQKRLREQRELIDKIKITIESGGLPTDNYLDLTFKKVVEEFNKIKDDFKTIHLAYNRDKIDWDDWVEDKNNPDLAKRGLGWVAKIKNDLTKVEHAITEMGKTLEKIDLELETLASQKKQTRQAAEDNK